MLQRWSLSNFVNLKMRSDAHMSTRSSDGELHFMNNRSRATLIVFFLGAFFFLTNTRVHSVVNLSMSRSFASSVTAGLLVGLLIGQLNLSSVWAAVSAGPFVTRLPWSLLLAVLTWVSFSLGVADDSQAVSNVGMFLAIGCIVTQMPLWFASRLLGWEMVQRSGKASMGPAEDASRDKQFQIKQVLIGTFALAVTLGVARYLQPLFELNTNLPPESYAFLSAAIVCNLLLAVPCVWFAMLTQLDWAKAFIAIAVAVLVSLLEFGGICLAIGGPGRDHFNWAMVFISTNLGQMIAVYVPLLLLKKYAGFELVRRNRHQSKPSQGASQPPAPEGSWEPVDVVDEDFFG